MLCTRAAIASRKVSCHGLQQQVKLQSVGLVHAALATHNRSSTRAISIYTVDAFATGAFEGNPAAVCMCDGPGPHSDAWMQSVALEMNLSETAFVAPLDLQDLVEAAGSGGGSGGGGDDTAGVGAAFGLRWFTPTDEVDLCGHATLASAHALWSTGRAPANEAIAFQTRWSGILYATPVAADWIELDFPSEGQSSPYIA